MYAVPLAPYQDINPIDYEREPVSGTWLIFIPTWLLMCGAGIALAVLADQLILGMVLLAIPTAVGILASPTFALCCIALVLPLSGSINFEGVLSADRMVGGLAALGILFHCKFLGHGLFLRGSPLMPMFLFAAWAAFSALWAPNKPLAFFASLTIVQLCIWGVAVWNAVAYRGKFIWPLRCYAAGMLLVVSRLYFTGGLARIARASGSATRLTIGGTNDQDVNPNNFATYLAAGFMVAVYLFLRDPAKVLRPLWVACAFFFPVMMILTGARSCLAGLAAALIVTMFTSYHFFRSKGMVVGLIVAGLVFVAGVQFVLSTRYAKLEGVQRIFDAKMRGESVGNRLELMEKSLGYILQNPILGTGYKNYATSLRTGTVVHNDMMLIAGELGIFGLFLFLYFFWKLYLTSVQIRAPIEKWFLRSVLIFFFVTGLAHPVFTIKALWFFTVLGAAIAYRTRAIESEQLQYQLTGAEVAEPEFPNWVPALSARPSYY